MNKKAQQLIFSSLFILFIFFFVVTIFFDELFPTHKLQDNQFDIINREAARVADNLARSGYPVDWTTTTIRRAGLTTENQFNQTKFDYLRELHDASYQDLKLYLGVRHEYGININDVFLGEPAMHSEEDLINAQPTYLTKQQRTVYQGSQPITITVYSYWREP